MYKSKTEGGGWVVQVRLGGQRRTVRLGQMTKRLAQSCETWIQHLANAKRVGAPLDPEAAAWLGQIDPVIYDRLAAVGLAEPRAARQGNQLGTFLDQYLKSRVDVKGSTKLVLGHTKRNLIDFFGAAKPISEITAGDADSFRLHLIEQKLADNTVRRRCGIAKQYFRVAVRQGLIPTNPFQDLVAAVRGNPAKFHFVTHVDTQKLLDACPDLQWRTLVALARYGGLRIPSEAVALRWGDVDWERGRMTVESPKTAHHEGHESRIVPLFPELRAILAEAFDAAAANTEFVITMRRDPKNNLRTRFQKIIRRAGLKPWPKLFQNLRSSRQTELCEKFPQHVVCAWIGNSQPVAAKHYLQVTDEHYARAAGIGTANEDEGRCAEENQAGDEATLEQRPGRDGRSALPKALPPSAVSPRTAPQRPNDESREVIAVPSFATFGENVLLGQMGDEGLDQISATGIQHKDFGESAKSGAAESAAVSEESAAIAAEIQWLAEHWPRLPVSIRSAILVLARASE